MDVTSTSQGDTTSIELSGRLDAITAPELEQQIRALIEAGARQLIIDFEQLDYISSAGLRVLLMTAKLLQAQQGEARLTGVKGDVASVFEMSGFNSLFKITEQAI